MSNLYQELLLLEENGYTPNFSSFFCTICMEEYDLHGIQLKTCLHTFCKDCITKTIQFSDVAEIKCPFKSNNVTNCDGILMDREIKSLLTVDQYEKYLAKSLQVAENCAPNSFHCLTLNCQGWCINDDNRLSLFMCPVCRADNCIKCQAIHINLNCKEYQDSTLEFKTNAKLDEMIRERSAMACPNCKVIRDMIIKKWS